MSNTQKAMAGIFEHACQLGREGIVSKRADSVYPRGQLKDLD
jgi:ATP-dependent DNA ligase